MLSAYAPQAAAVLGRLRVDAKTNEHKAALRLLDILPPLRGAGAEILSGLRDAAVFLLGKVKSAARGRPASKAAAVRRLAAHPKEAWI